MKELDEAATSSMIGDPAFYMAGISIDNVIFGFHDLQLRVLLLECKDEEYWMLPGGYIKKEESIEQAAQHILKERTGLDNVYLQQFGVYGDIERSDNSAVSKFVESMELDKIAFAWHLQRFITIGYYALVEFETVQPKPDPLSLSCKWFELDNLPKLIFDHKQLVSEALQSLRLQLNFQPIGYNLLPETFTLKSLQAIYETILNRKLDRANFNRKILSMGILDKREKLYTGGAHKAPYQYSFNKVEYFRLLKEGFGSGF